MSYNFTVLNSEGKEVEMELLFSFDYSVTGKSYLVYTDYTTDEEDNVKVYASVYDPTGQDPTLYPVQTEDEWDAIELELNELQNKAQALADFEKMKPWIIE